MFDGLRNDASDPSGFDEPVEFFPGDNKSAALVRRRKPGQFLGMTAQQRFLISVMLMIAMCVLGMMCMLITGKFAF